MYFISNTSVSCRIVLRLAILNSKLVKKDIDEKSSVSFPQTHANLCSKSHYLLLQVGLYGGKHP